MSESGRPRPSDTGGDPARPADGESADGDLDGEGVTVLHVDADPAVGTLVEEFLACAIDGVTVVTETDAADGLDRVAEGDVDCVVSDLQLRGMDGNALARGLASRYPRVPVVLFTNLDRCAVAYDVDRTTTYVSKRGRRQFETLVERVRSLVA